MADSGYIVEAVPAEQLLQAMQGLVKMVRIYQANNQMVVNCIQQLVTFAQELLQGHDQVTIDLKNGSFFVNDEELVKRKGASNALESFYVFLSDRRISGFRILPGIADATPDELTSFAKLLGGCADQPDPAEWLELQLVEAAINWAAVLRSEDNAGLVAEIQPVAKKEAPVQHDPGKIYAYTLRALREAAELIGEGKRFGMRKTGRMIQTMVEEISSQESRLLVMSTLRDYSDQMYFHSVNVAILAIHLGRELGLAKDALERLGTCALFHDLGKVMVPEEILTRSGMLSEADFARVQQHSLDSARLILQGMVAPVDRKAAIMIPAFEHHLKADLSGYPALGWRKSPSLPGRIVAVADAYDALTSARVYRRKPMSGDRALGLMRVGAGNAFDPLVLRAFTRMLGVYPVGTLLELEGGQSALVSRTPLTDDLTRPRAMLLVADGQGGYNRGEEINLAERDAAGGHRYRIVDSAHPAVRNIQPAQLLI